MVLSRMRLRRLGLLMITCLALSALPMGVFAVPVSAPHLTVELLTPTPAVMTPGSLQVGLYYKLDPGWHIYWQNPGDSGLPPTIKWTLPAGFSAGALQFPVPKRLPLGPLMDFGYDNEVLFPIEMRVSSALKPDQKATLAAKVNWLVCREVCLPGKANVTLEIRGSAAAPTPDP